MMFIGRLERGHRLPPSIKRLTTANDKLSALQFYLRRNFSVPLLPTQPDPLFQIRRQHIFDPFHECADSAR